MFVLEPTGVAGGAICASESQCAPERVTCGSAGEPSFCVGGPAGWLLNRQRHFRFEKTMVGMEAGSWTIYTSVAVKVGRGAT